MGVGTRVRGAVREGVGGGEKEEGGEEQSGKSE